MGSRSILNRLMSNRTLLGVAAVLVLLGTQTTLSAQAARLNWQPSEGSATRNITLSADAVSSWTEQDRLVVLLKGKVFIQQGLIQCRMENALVLVDTAAKKKTGSYTLEVYGEGDVSVLDGSNNVTGAKPAAQALFSLSTRNQVQAKAYGGKALQQAQTGDPVYQRAKTARNGPPPTALAAAGGAVVTAGGVVTPGNLVQTAAQNPPTQLPPPPPTTNPFPVVAPPPSPSPQNVPGTPVQQFLPLQPPQGKSPSLDPNAQPPFLPPPGQQTLPTPPTGPMPKVIPLEDQAPKVRKQLIIQPRSSQELKARNFPQPNGETVVVVSGGIILTVISPDVKSVVDIEADRLVFWTRGDAKQTINDLRSATPESGSKDENNNTPEEFYLSGNVELRQQNPKESRLMRSDELYYNTAKNLALALHAEIEIKQLTLVEPMHITSPKVVQTNAKQTLVADSDTNASKLPYDPGLKISFSDSTITEITVPKKTIFGFPVNDPKTGQPEQEVQRIFEGRNFVLYLGGIPIFYLPYLAGDINDPLGPLNNFSFNYNKIFGYQFFTTFDAFELFGIHRAPGTRWVIDMDVMTARGPALGSDFTLNTKDFLGIPNKTTGELKVYGIHDTGQDILGGGRGTLQYTDFNPIDPWIQGHPDYRGRFLGLLNMQEMPLGFSVVARASVLSDRNFMEQFYAQEFQQGLNQESFLYVKEQLGIWAWSAIVEPRDRVWVTEAERLPEAEGHIIGEKFFDLFTYVTRAKVGYYDLLPTHDQTGPLLPTDQQTTTGRFDLWQEASLPFQLGAFKIVPYGVIDLTQYTQDLNGNAVGRVYGAGGLRASLPLSRLYSDVHSDLFNLNGIFHKIVLSGNYYNAYSNTPYTQLPQIDRIEDDNSDQGLRDIRAYQPYFNPKYGTLLTTLPLYNPQIVAIQQLATYNVDTLNTMQVLQLDLRQRWQTKRGFPGQEHVVDWMTLDLSASYFPAANRDDFGASWAYLQYDWVWNIGDRTALFSNGWVDPIENGPKTFTFGGTINRPNATNFLLAYRYLEPLNSQSVIASATFPFSTKYSATASLTYDFINNMRNVSVFVTRKGTDVTANIGFSQNSVLNTVTFMFQLYPNLMPGTTGPGSGSIFGSSQNPMNSR